MSNVFDAGDALSTEPQVFRVGDFVQWKREALRNTYGTGYTAEYVARIAGGSDEIKIAQAGGTTTSYFLFTADTSTTAAYTAGDYQWQLEITQTSSSNRAVVEVGTWTIKPDLDAASADPRSTAQIMLDKIESVLTGRADGDVASYSIEGRSLQKIPVLELMTWRDRYRAEVAKERNDALLARGKKGAASIQVRF